jgi:hypothetical protein
VTDGGRATGPHRRVGSGALAYPVADTQGIGRTEEIAMGIRPDLPVSVTTAQSIVDRAVTGRTVAAVSKIHGREIAAVYEVAFDPAHPRLVLKVYPDELHWKMAKEVSVIALIQDRLGVSVPRVLVADDSKCMLDLNFIVAAFSSRRSPASWSRR